MLKERVRSAPKKKVTKSKKETKGWNPDTVIIDDQLNAKKVFMAVDKLSYSSILQLLKNPIIFKMRYVFKVYTNLVSPTALVGRACHEALKFYYGGNPDIPVPLDRAEAIGQAKQLGLEYIDAFPDGGIKFGKTGSRESIMKTYTQAMMFYFNEEPEYDRVISSEEKITTEITTKEGEQMPLPLVSIPDLIVQPKEYSENDVDIIDTKFVGTFTDWELEDYTKIIQAKCLEYAVRHGKGMNPKRVIFRELKTSENREAGPQMRDYVIECDHYAYDLFFVNLYKDVCKFLSNPDALYLPNIGDQYDGDEAGLIYSQGLINADMQDVEVMHKIKDVQLTGKKFVPARTDSAENQHLLPAEKVKMKLGEFGIPVEHVESIVGATFTQHRYKVSAGVKMVTLTKYKADIAKVLETKGDVRILAPIPGTSLVGVEVVNESRGIATLQKEDLTPGTLYLPVGQGVDGETVKEKLDEMPHLLIAGSSGSGKSVVLHTLISALTKQLEPKMLHLVLLDPKRVELVAFAKSPHLHGRKIIYEYNDGVVALLNLVDTMEERYEKLERNACRNIGEYNAKGYKMPYIVVVIDELADFILRSKIEEKSNKSKAYSSRSLEWLASEVNSRGLKVSASREDTSNSELKKIFAEALEKDDATNAMKRADADVELLIVRIAQLGRAAGIHLILATQRPSVDVVTGLIKANIPARIALTCASPTDSQVILGETGAENLTGKGDMIFMHPSSGKVRLQGFINQ